MRKLLMLLLPLTLILTSCNLFDNYGKKAEINDKLTVYYKGEGVTEAEAKKLGAFLEQNRGGNKEEHYYHNKEQTERITKEVSL